MLYFLLGVIAVGVLLASESGKSLLVFSIIGGLVCGAIVLAVGVVWVLVSFLISDSGSQFIFSYKFLALAFGCVIVIGFALETKP